jgi:hypothetical protein
MTSGLSDDERTCLELYRDIYVLQQQLDARLSAIIDEAAAELQNADASMLAMVRERAHADPRARQLADRIAACQTIWRLLLRANDPPPR